MGSSFVGLGDQIPEDKQTEWIGESYGFWAKDTPLLIWLTAMGEVVDELQSAPVWLKSMRKDWNDAFNGVGCVVTGFEENLREDERRKILLDVALKTLERLLVLGGDYRRAFPSTVGLDETFSGVRPLQLSDKVGLIELGSNVARLLKGEIKTGERGPLAWGYGPRREVI